MKKLLLYSLIALTLLAVPSCSKDKEDEPNPITFTVTFDTDGGTEIPAQTVENGKTAKPQKTTKEYFTFQGWYLNDKVYDFSSAVTSDITLKAYWQSDNAFVAKVFSVSETKQVYFSSGNLQYHCKNKEWRFAPLQYDLIGLDNENISDDYDGYIDLFGWGTGDNPTLSSKNNEDYVIFTDWGTKIDDGNVWQTLSIDEWEFLVFKREGASDRIGLAKVVGIKGLILLPDGWVLPTGLLFQKYQKGVTTDNNYSADEWRKMESAGAVFLPFAHLTRSGTSFYLTPDEGEYWSSTSLDYPGVRALYIIWERGPGFLSKFAGRYEGLSVRLVRPL